MPTAVNATINGGRGTIDNPYVAVFRGQIARNEWNVLGVQGVHITHGTGPQRAPSTNPTIVVGRPLGIGNLRGENGAAAATLRFTQAPWYVTGIAARVRIFNAATGAEETQGAAADAPELGALLPNPGGNDTLGRDLAAGANAYRATVRVGAPGSGAPVPRSGKWRIQIAMVSPRGWPAARLGAGHMRC